MLRKSKFLLLLAAMLLPAWTLAQGYQQPVGVLPPNVNIKDVHIEQRLGNKVVNDAVFTDQNGNQVQFSKVSRGLPILILPIFFKCTGVCTVELQGVLSTLQKMKTKRVGRDFDVVALSIDPTEGPDLSAAKMRETIASFPNLKGTEAGWRFLTGDLPNIRKVTDSLGFKFTWDPEKKIVNHPSGIMFLTPQEVVSSYVFGVNYSPDVFEKNITLAHGNRIGKRSTEIFFGCVHVDPITGQRSIVILNFLKFLALVTLIGLLGTIAGLSLKNRFAQKSTK